MDDCIEEESGAEQHRGMLAASWRGEWGRKVGAMASKCIICHDRTAELPDRYSGSSRKKVCRECHAKRLQQDLAAIFKRDQQKGE